MVLNKEFEFYEKTSNVVSELGVDIQDLLYYVTLKEGEHSNNIDAARKVILNILKNIPTYKNVKIVYSCYIIQVINNAATKLIKDLQDNINYMSEC